MSSCFGSFYCQTKNRYFLSEYSSLPLGLNAIQIALAFTLNFDFLNDFIIFVGFASL